MEFELFSSIFLSDLNVPSFWDEKKRKIRISLLWKIFSSLWRTIKVILWETKLAVVVEVHQRLENLNYTNVKQQRKIVSKVNGGEKSFQVKLILF